MIDPRMAQMMQRGMPQQQGRGIPQGGPRGLFGQGPQMQGGLLGVQQQPGPQIPQGLLSAMQGGQMPGMSPMAAGALPGGPPPTRPPVGGPAPYMDPNQGPPLSRPGGGDSIPTPPPIPHGLPPPGGGGGGMNIPNSPGAYFDAAIPWGRDYETISPQLDRQLDRAMRMKPVSTASPHFDVYDVTGYPRPKDDEGGGGGGGGGGGSGGGVMAFRPGAMPPNWDDMSDEEKQAWIHRNTMRG